MSLIWSQMGHGGHRDDRRRRLLSEDLTANSGLAAQDFSGTSPRNDQPHAHKSENYGDAEFCKPTSADRPDSPTSDFLSPAAYGWSGRNWRIDGPLCVDPGPATRPANSAGNGGTRQLRSLGSWFASLLLLAAGLLAIVTYSVRRYKADDYHGHYHVWLWAAACWFIMGWISPPASTRVFSES